MTSIIHLENIRKSYYMGKNVLEVLKGVSLDINKNEYVALMGPSGSGKSTLMNILGCRHSFVAGTGIDLHGHACVASFLLSLSITPSLRRTIRSA